MPTKPKPKGSRTSGPAKPPAQDAIALLKEDHKKVRGLFAELEGTTGREARKREKLLDQIETELKVHTQIEEEIFYPAFREAAEDEDDRKLFFEAAEEHHLVDLVMPEIRDSDPATAEFAAKAKVLKDVVEHHAEEEEHEMFPRARKLLGREELRDLGARMAERKSDLLHGA